MIIINGSDDEFDQPNAKPGYCPVCSQKINLWNAKRNKFECSFCNYAGIRTEPRPAYFNCKDSMRKHAND